MMQGEGVTRTSGAELIRTTQLGFPAELTSGWDSTDGYSWKRLTKQGQEAADPTMQLVGKNAITPDNDESLESGTQGWMEPDPGRRGYFFLTFGSGGSGGSGGTGGCGWVDALTDDDCLKFSLVSASGRCGCAETLTPLLLTYQSADDGGTWGTGDTFEICGVKYIPTFKREACNGPCLSFANVPEGSTPCCDLEDEGTAASVTVTMTVDGVEYTGTLLLTGGYWTGELEAEEEPVNTAACTSGGCSTAPFNITITFDDGGSCGCIDGQTIGVSWTGTETVFGTTANMWAGSGTLCGRAVSVDYRYGRYDGAKNPCTDLLLVTDNATGHTMGSNRAPGSCSPWSVDHSGVFKLNGTAVDDFCSGGTINAAVSG